MDSTNNRDHLCIADVWTIARSAAGAAAAASGASAIYQATQTVDNLTTTATPKYVIAANVTPRKSGIFQVNFSVKFTLAAADSVQAVLEGYTTGVGTGFTGGTAGAHGWRYAVDPLVAPGGSPAAFFATINTYAAGNIASATLTASGLAVLLPGAGLQAIGVLLSTGGGQNLSAIAVSASAFELG